MKYIIFSLLIMVSFSTFAQQHQLGVRLGDPYGITYKTPISDRFSVEAVLGRGSQNSSQYYKRTFENDRPVSSARYFSHQASGAISVQARGIYEASFTDDFNISKGEFTVYTGLGIQFRSANINYFYNTPNAEPGTAVVTEKRTNIDFGPEVFVGSAYYFEDLPISIFIEAGFLTEIVDRLHVKAQGAIGVRYLFGE